MFVTRLDGSGNSDDTIYNPSLEQIASAIERLAGGDVCIGTADETPHLCVGGGPEFYIVSVTWDNLSFSTLLADSNLTGEIEFVCGGQWGDYPARYCVTRQIAQEAAKEFALYGRTADWLDWEIE